MAIRILTGADDSWTGRLLDQEMERAWKLSDQVNVLHVVDLATSGAGKPALVTAYCGLGSLGDRLRSSGPLPVDMVVDAAIPIARALHAAHGLGLVHRGIKPNNLLLTTDSMPMLADFVSSGVRASNFSPAGAAVLSYAAPDVVAHEAPSPRSDVYSLAATLLHLLTGTVPRPEPAYMNALLAAASGRLPTSLHRALARAVQWHPGARYPTALAFADELALVASYGNATMRRQEHDRLYDPPAAPEGGYPEWGRPEQPSHAMAIPATSATGREDATTEFASVQSYTWSEQNPPDAGQLYARPRRAAGTLTALVVLAVLTLGALGALTALRAGGRPGSPPQVTAGAAGPATPRAEGTVAAPAPVDATSAAPAAPAAQPAPPTIEDAAFEGASGPGCPDGAGRYTAVARSDPDGDGWRPGVEGGWVGDGCEDAIYLYTKLANLVGDPGRWEDSFAWYFNTGLSGPIRCVIAVYIPDADVANGTADYWVTAGSDKYEDLIISAAIDQAESRGLWVTLGAVVVATGFVRIEIDDNGPGATVTVVAGPAYATCSSV